jgi:hypothetical protein
MASISEASAISPAPTVVTVARLSPEVYKKFESSLPKAVIDRQAGDAGCDAAFKLGVQYVLSKLRDDLVVE